MPPAPPVPGNQPQEGSPRRGSERPFDTAVTPDEIEMLLKIFDELDEDHHRNGDEGPERAP
jgi:hypothetical protein